MATQLRKALEAKKQTEELRLIRLTAVMRRIGMGRSWVYARVAAGEFPQPVRLGAKAVGWIESEVDAWIAARVAAARKAA